MNANRKLVLLLPLSLPLSACPSGSDEGSGTNPGLPDDGVSLCPYVTGGALAFTPLCADCEISNAEAAHDGNPYTFASITVPDLPGGMITLRANAAEGVTYPMLTNAAVIVGVSGAPGTTIYSDYEVRTYLSGVPVSTNNSVSPQIIAGSGNTEPQRVNVFSVGPYDAVELIYSRAAGTQAISLNVYEFCADI